MEADTAVRPGIVDARRLARSDQLGVVGMVVKGPGRPAAQHKGVECRIGEPAPQAKPEARPDVAYPVELVPYPALFESLPHLRSGISAEPREHRLGRHHA